MWNLKNIRVEVDQDQVLTASLNMPERSVNVFEETLLKDLTEIVD